MNAIYLSFVTMLPLKHVVYLETGKICAKTIHDFFRCKIGAAGIIWIWVEYNSLSKTTIGKKGKYMTLSVMWWCFAAKAVADNHSFKMCSRFQLASQSIPSRTRHQECSTLSCKMMRSLCMCKRGNSVSFDETLAVCQVLHVFPFSGV